MLRVRNAVDDEIARIICRPAKEGHIGEYVASAVFGIDLERSATHMGYDGRFTVGALSGKSVNVKYYGKREGILDINPSALPDYFLVLTGARAQPQSSRGTKRPWVVEAVYLFDASATVQKIRRRAELRGRIAKIGDATSIWSALWDEAEVYPTNRNTALMLSDEQRLAIGKLAGVAM